MNQSKMEQEKYSESSLNNSSPPFKNIYRNYDHEISSEFHADSAYSSGYNLSSCETPNASHNIGLEISTPHCVNVIHDTSKDSMKLTPVTQNICRIFNFHITTPKSVDLNKRQAAGVKRSSQYNLQSTPKKLRLADENDQENQLYGSITPSKSIQKKQPLSESKQNIFDRLNSAPDLRDNTSYVKYNSQYNRENKLTTIAENIPTKPNSIKKLLKCSNDEFEAILSNDITPSKKVNFQDHRTSYSIKSPYSFEKKKKFNNGKTSFCRTLSFATSPKIELKNFQRTKSDELDISDTSLIEFEKCEKLNTTQGSADMDISPLVPMKFKKDCSQKIDNIRENIISTECENIPVTPKKRKISFDNTVQEKSSYPKTPKKMKYQFSPKHINSKPYKNIPKETGKKSIAANFRTPTKFNLTKHKNLRLHQQKTKGDFISRPCSLNILEKLSLHPILIDNVFSHLSSYDLLNLRRVSESCSNIVNNHPRTKAKIEIFLNNYSICKENFNEKEFDQVKDKLLDTHIINTDKRLDKKVPFSCSNTEIKQKQCLEDLEEEPTKIKGFKSPNVSPSKRKFYENQKLVNTLSEKQHCVKCPRCGRPSRAVITQDQVDSEMDTGILSSSSFSHHNIISNRAENNYNRNSISTMDSTPFQPLHKKKLMKTMSVDSGLFMKRFEARSSSPTTNFQPYGECTALSCNMKFCLKCYCEHHPGKLCVLELDTGSPKKDELNEKLCSKSNRSFKRRKSLKRLCF